MNNEESRGESRSSRPGSGIRSAIDPWQLALGGLLLLAVVATVLMVFSDDRLWMRIGTLAALWAAFIALFLVARYRRLAASESARVRDLHTVYELQLEREVNARYEYELEVEKRHRDSSGSPSDDSLAALRQEIHALREQLSTLTGGQITPESPTLGTGRVASLERGTERSGPRTSVPSERVQRRGQEGSPWSSSAGTSRPPQADYGRPSGAGSRPSARPSSRPTTPPRPQSPARPAQEPSSGRTPTRPEYQAPTRSEQPQQPAAPRSTPGTQAPPPEYEAPKREQRTPTSRPVQQAETAASTAGGTQASPPSRHAKPESPKPERAAPEPPAHHADAPAAPEDDDSPSRHSEGSSVADLIARLNAESGGASTGGRRRRRAEDR